MRTKNDRYLPNLLTLSEASRVLKVHPNTLRSWDKKGLLKSVRFGVRGDRAYRLDDIYNLIDKKNVKVEKNLELEILQKTNSLLKLTLDTIVSLIDSKKKKGSDIYFNVVNQAMILTRAEYASITFYKNKSLQTIYSSNPILSEIKFDSMLYLSIVTKTPVIIQIKDVKNIQLKIPNTELKTLILIPISNKKGAIYCINLFTKEEVTFNSDELSALKVFGEICYSLMNEYLPNSN